MPDTPETWLAAFTANKTTTDSQNDPHITQLANGNILVSWTSTADTGAGSPPDRDVIGQIFSPEGEPLGDELLLNQTYFDLSERDADIAALPNGGFIVVYKASSNALRFDRYDANGMADSDNNTVFSSLPAGITDFDNPTISVSHESSALITYRVLEPGGDSEIRGRIYNPTTGVVGPEQNLIAYPGSNSDNSTTVLANGNYVIVDSHLAGGDSRIVIRIVNQAGNNVLGATPIASTNADGESDSDPDVAALTGGGFVVVWTNTDADTDLLFSIFTAAGVLAHGPNSVNAGGNTDNNNDPSVVALSDGGFILFYDDDETGQHAGRAQRYSETGVAVGTTFVFDGGDGSVTDAVLLDDGRVALTFVDGDEISMTIYDTRDAPNTVIGDSGVQAGTIGDDDIGPNNAVKSVYAGDGHDEVQASANDTAIYGGKGSDTLHGGVGDDALYGGNDGDQLSGGAGADLMVGGAGSDWASYVSAAGGVVADLLDPSDNTGDAAGDTYFGIENIAGSNYSDVLRGTNGANAIYAYAGDDLVRGRGGNDTLTGASGNDTLDGGSGADTLRAGTGDDVYIVDNTGDTIVEYADAGTDTVQSKISYTLGFELENLRLTGSAGLSGTGNADANQIIGNDGANLLTGLAGNDELVGRDGRDKLFGNGNNDTLDGGSGRDSLFGGSGDDSLLGGGSADKIKGGGGGDTLYGHNGDDRLFGNNGDDRLRAGNGADRAYGGSGSDRIEGQNGDDRLDGGKGGDRLEGNAGDDRLYGAKGADLLKGNAGADNLSGGSGNDTLFGGSKADVLLGGTGKDQLGGGRGADIFVFNSTGESGARSKRADVIVDFGANDTIKLRGIDADTTHKGNDAFTFIGTHAFSGEAGELRYRVVGDGARVFADTNGDGKADMQIRLTGIDSLTAADFIL